MLQSIFFLVFQLNVFIGTHFVDIVKKTKEKFSKKKNQSNFQ